MIFDASPKASPLLALTYGVRQALGTGNTLTYRFGPDVGLRNTPEVGASALLNPQRFELQGVPDKFLRGPRGPS